jgi:hypothetical protein
MALGRDVVDAIIREHSYQPIVGDVMLIGHLEIVLSFREVLELLQEHGVAASAHDRSSEDPMTASALLELLGVNAMRVLDAQQGDVVCDLTAPIPKCLESSADFIIDGGMLADMFSPSAVVRNYTAMLRPGGRLLAINNLSAHFDPYSIMSPSWYLDYFVVNEFADCKVYVLVYPPDQPVNAFCVDIDCLLDPDREVRSFLSPFEMAIVLFAEKGAASTDETMPIHPHRRSVSECERYRQSLRRINQSARPHIVRSRGELDEIDVRGGHLYVRPNYQAVEPSALAAAVPERSEAAARHLKVLCVGTGRDGTQSLCNMIAHVFKGSERGVMHEYCCREFYQAFCDFREAGEPEHEKALRRMVAECGYDCIVGNGYAAILPLFAEQYGRELKIVHIQRSDRDSCIASLMKNCELFPTAYCYYSTSPDAVVKRMAAFHFEEMSRSQWDKLAIHEKFGWYYDKTHALIDEYLGLFDHHLHIKTEDLDSEEVRRAIAKFVGESSALPPKAHLNASVIDIASFPKSQQHKMHWLMGRFNLEELADDDVYALDYFLDKFVAWTGYQLERSPDLQGYEIRPDRIADNLERAAMLLKGRLGEMERLLRQVQNQERKDSDK